MHIAFYAPMKSPNHPVPSGDRLIAQLYMQALQQAGHKVELVSELRSWNGSGDPIEQSRIDATAHAEIQRLHQTWKHDGTPDLWFTYHVYHKAPDLLGPTLAEQFGLPYVIAEPSHAPKQQHGPWAAGYAAAARCIRQASVVLVQNPADRACLTTLVATRDRIVELLPFINLSAWQKNPQSRSVLARQFDVDLGVPWIATVAMMRSGDKLASYELMADSLKRVKNDQWQLVIIGDGQARAEVEAAFAPLGDRVRWLGQGSQSMIHDVLHHSDLFFWPAINEAIGMSLLEAQATGLAVIAGDEGGVARVVRHQKTGILIKNRDSRAFAQALDHLLDTPSDRLRFGKQARQIVVDHHSLEAAAQVLDEIIQRVTD